MPLSPHLRRLAIAAALAAGLATATAPAAAAHPDQDQDTHVSEALAKREQLRSGADVPLLSSPNVHLENNRPDTTAISGCFAHSAPYFYVSSLTSITVFDVGDPLSPQPTGVLDVTDPAKPFIRSRGKTSSSTHTVACVDDAACDYAYTAGGSVVDLTDLDNPREIKQVDSRAGPEPGVHQRFRAQVELRQRGLRHPHRVRRFGDLRRAGPRESTARDVDRRDRHGSGLERLHPPQRRPAQRGRLHPGRRAER